jgi:hypothetical protein
MSYLNKIFKLGIVVCTVLISTHLEAAKKKTAQDNSETSSIHIPKHQNIILYPKGFEQIAKQFKEFHKISENAESTLISLEDIKKKPRKYTAKPKFDGYENTKPQETQINNYDYETALKLADYLKDYSQNKQIDSLLILGSGGLVPPSYYFYIPYENDLPAPSYIRDYTHWIASDIFYGSLDFTWDYKWSVGRVSVHTPEEARIYLNKLKHFKEQNKKNPPVMNIYAGCNVLHDYQFMGEMFYLAMQDKKVFGDAVKWYSESSGKFLKANMMDSFTKDNALFHWIYSHGMGEGFVMSNNEKVKVDDILTIPLKQNLPLILSPSCLDAGFDYDVIRMPWQKDVNKSVGEAILTSKGAGIGYIGSARLALAGMDFKTDKKTGKVMVEKATYMPDLLLDFLVAYVHKGHRRIGDAFKVAHNDYLAQKNTDQNDPGFKAMYVNYCFLGDPVVSLPEPPAYEPKGYKGVEFLNVHFTDEVDDGITVPGYTPSSHSLSGPTTVMFSSNGQTKFPINYQIIDVNEHKLIESGLLTPGNTHTFRPIGSDKTYLLKTWVGQQDTKESDTGRLLHGNEVAWHYFRLGKSDQSTPEEVLKRSLQKEIPHLPLTATKVAVNAAETAASSTATAGGAQAIVPATPQVVTPAPVPTADAGTDMLPH